MLNFYGTNNILWMSHPQNPQLVSLTVVRSSLSGTLKTLQTNKILQSSATVVQIPLIALFNLWPFGWRVVDASQQCTNANNDMALFHR